MNGRCENHLLELAANVCDSCYGEFCDECLKQPGSRKHPICTDCILLASGVRTGAKTERRGEKRTARSRRKALQERQGSLPGAFRFFDEDQPSGVASEPSAALAAEFSGDAAKRGGRRRRGRRGPSAPSDAETPVLAEPADLHEVERHSSNEAAPAPAMTPAVAKLEAMRRGDDESFASTPTEGDEIIADNTVIDQTTAEGRIADPTDACDRAEVDDPAEINDPAEVDDPAELVAMAVMAATEVIAETVEPEDVAAIDVAPEAPIESDAHELAPPVLANTDEQVEAGHPSTDRDVQDRLPDASALTAEESVAAVDCVTTPGARGRRASDQPGGAKPNVAPMIGEVRTIGGKRAEDRRPARSPSPPDMQPGRGGPDNAGAKQGVEQFDATRLTTGLGASTPVGPGSSRSVQRRPTATETRSGPTSPRPAAGGDELDASGNWVPPALRGASQRKQPD